MTDAIDSILSSSKKEPRFYQLLNCDKSSSTEQIQAEYRQLARKLHPDKQTEEDRPEASKKFSEIQNAYELLTNENRRKLYDQWLSYPLPMDFEEFERNSDAIRMSMHWASPRQTPMIAPEEKEKKKPEEKTSLPKGVKQKAKKAKPQGPKRGHNVYIAPKKQHLIQRDKIEAEVTKVINEKNEELAKGRIDAANGKI